VPDVNAKPHPIYGTIPIGRDGFTLERQSIQMLDFWHRKAVDICEGYEKSPDASQWDAFEKIVSIQLDIYRAAVRAKPRTASEVALVLEIIARYGRLCRDENCEFLNLEELSAIAQYLSDATKPISPKKRVGALRHGRQLTRFGLIHRYQAFLIQELETIGWHVYGERDYPMMFRPYDDAVNDRCKTPNGRGQSPMFFSPEKLTSRARNVLKSLKIDTERSEEHSTNRPKLKDS
jgi:hypothetical protein